MRESNGVIDNEDAIFELAEVVSKLEERITALEELGGEDHVE